MNKSVFIVIPTYNEKENIVALVQEIFKLNSELSVLVVDDASPDGTAREIKKIQPLYINHLFLLERSGKLGLGSAYREGFKYCLDKGAEVIGEMDADFSHQPKDLIKLLAEIDNGAKVVIGSRRIKGGQIIGWNWWRQFMSFGANSFSRIILGLKTKDVTAGFRLYTKDSLSLVPWLEIKTNGYAWQEEMVYSLEKNKVSIVEVPVVFIDRKKGSSKLKYQDIIDFFVTVIRLKF